MRATCGPREGPVMKLLYEANALRLLLVPFFTAALIAQSPQQSAASLAIRGVTS